LQDQGVGGKMESEWNLRRWIEFDWHRTGTGSELLWVRSWTSGFLRHRVSSTVSRNFEHDTWDRTWVTPVARTGGTYV
jgi:hypothetical protein